MRKHLLHSCHVKLRSWERTCCLSCCCCSSWSTFNFNPRACPNMSQGRFFTRFPTCMGCMGLFIMCHASLHVCISASLPLSLCVSCLRFNAVVLHIACWLCCVPWLSSQQLLGAVESQRWLGRLIHGSTRMDRLTESGAVSHMIFKYANRSK